jgi:SLT domain-containing protein
VQNTNAGFNRSGIGFATGGIGTREMDARLFEGNRAEAVVPLETSAGQDALANAATQGLQRAGGAAQQTEVHINIPGMLVTDDIGKWRNLVQSVAEELFRQNMQRGVM